MRTDDIGYFDVPGDTPAYDPGMNAICPFCNRVLSADYSSHFLSVNGVGDRIYFYRFCRQHLNCEDQKQLDEFWVKAGWIDLTATNLIRSSSIVSDQPSKVHNE